MIFEARLQFTYDKRFRIRAKTKAEAINRLEWLANDDNGIQEIKEPYGESHEIVSGPKMVRFNE